MISATIGIVRQKMRDAKISGRKFGGVMLLGEAKRETPAQPELRPAAPGELIRLNATILRFPGPKGDESPPNQTTAATSCGEAKFARIGR
jgi:hypothetical protein